MSKEPVKTQQWLPSLIVGFASGCVCSLAGGGWAGRELGDPSSQRVCAFQELHRRDSGSSAGGLASFLLEQRHEVLVAGAGPLAAPERQRPQVAAAGAVLDGGHQALAAAEGIRRLLTTQNLSLGPEQRGELIIRILYSELTEEVSGNFTTKRQKTHNLIKEDKQKEKK